MSRHDTAETESNWGESGVGHHDDNDDDDADVDALPGMADGARDVDEVYIAALTFLAVRSCRCHKGKSTIMNPVINGVYQRCYKHPTWPWMKGTAPETPHYIPHTPYPTTHTPLPSPYPTPSHNPHPHTPYPDERHCSLPIGQAMQAVSDGLEVRWLLRTIWESR